MKHVYTKILFIGLLLMGFSNWGFGQNRNYLEFDGTNDYVKYTSDSKLQGMNGASNYTIEAWIYVPSSASTVKDIMYRYHQFYITYSANNSLRFYVYVSSKSQYYYYSTSSNAITTDTWHHIAIVRNTSLTHYMHIYVDGVDKISGSYNGYVLTSTNSYNLYIGNSNSGTSYCFKGYIDEVRLSAAATSVASLHSNSYDNQYVSGTYTKALLHFNEGTGTTTTNEVYSSSSITLVNGTAWRAWDYVSTKHLPLAHEWTGATSTDWATVGNWTPTVPTLANDVLIPNVTNQPTISSGNISLNNFRIETSATITIASGVNFSPSGYAETNGYIVNNGNIILTGDVNNRGNVTNNGNITSSGNITVENTGTLTNNASGTITANGAMETKGTFTNNGTFNIGNTYTFSGNYDPSSGNVAYIGSTTQTIVVPSNDYKNLTISNSAGVSLDGSVTVSGTLTLTDGIITSTSTNKLTMADGSSVSGGSNTAFVDGPMAKIGNTDFVFPVGNVDTLGQIGISNLSASETFTAQYTKAESSNSSSLTYPLTKVSQVESWQLDRAGTASADVTLYWQDSKYSGIGNLTDLRVAHYNGSAWEEQSGTITTTGSASLTSSQSGSIKVTGVSSFSPFTYGTLDNTTNTLPVELISFNLSPKDNSINLQWQTASELNNNGFEIQRSEDAESWEKIGFVKGNGNSNTIQNYTFNDNSPKVFNYYRLKQIDFDGAFKYSDIKFLKLGQTLTINISPNPVANILNIDVDNAQQIDIYDVAGKLVKHYSAFSQSIDVSDFTRGVYFFIVTKNDGTQARGEFMKN